MHTTINFEAIGTSWRIDIYESLAENVAAAIEEKIKKRIDVFDRDYSRFRNDSLVHSMSKKAGTYTLPQDAKPLFDLYQQLYKITNGAFTPLIGDTLIQAGYDADYSLIPGILTKPLSWDEAIVYDFPTLTILKPTMLDLGGLGKGYLVDIVAGLILEENILSFTVDAGGDMYTFGNKMIIGLEHPHDHKKVIGTIEVENESICGSSGSRRAWGVFHHIIDPRTLKSPEDIIASWAIAKTTLIADAMATCLFLVSGATLKAQFDFEYVVIGKDLSAEKSSSFTGALYTE
jgi:thiamine biosynthesis lipoprotein